MSANTSAPLNDSSAPALATSPEPSAWRSLLLVFVLALVVAVPRSCAVVSRTTDTFDEAWHYASGLRFLDRDFKRLLVNDPFTGQAIIALPTYLAGARSAPTPPAAAGEKPANDYRDVFHTQKGLSAQTIRHTAAVFQSVLFAALVAGAFMWGRKLYGPAAGWVAAIALLIEPTFAAHAPLFTLDVIGVEAIALGCALLWKYFEKPTRLAAAVAGASVGLALVIKFTALGLPAVAAGFAGLWWVIKPWREKVAFTAWRKDLVWRVGHLALMGVSAGVAIWALNFFEVGPLPFGEKFHQDYKGRMIVKIADAPWPAPHYVYSFLQGARHDAEGHPTALNGHISNRGVWYYFPVVATMKIPLGLWVVLALGIASLARRRFAWQEWSLIVPIVVWSALLVRTQINIGFRHFLPPYFFLLIWASRSVSLAGLVKGGELRVWRGAAIAGLAAAAIHTALWHPNYLAYFNAPRAKRDIALTDSNVDWGQALPQVQEYLKAHPPTKEKPVYLWYNGSMPRDFTWDLPGWTFSRVGFMADERERVKDGVLIVSQTHYMSLMDPRQPVRTLWKVPPTAVIGESIYVFDLKALGPGFKWDPLHPAPKGSQVLEPAEKMDPGVRALLSVYRIE